MIHCHGASGFELHKLDSVPFSSDDTCRQTTKDTILSLVCNWPFTSHEFEPFLTRHNELSIQSDVVLWDSHIVILTTPRRRFTDELHEGYERIVKMKASAISYLGFQGLDNEMEKKAKSCKMYIL